MSSSAPRLEIYLIGAHKGESIVIRTPGGSLGVVDAYAPTWDDPTTNPTLEKLNKLGAERLRFVALTHPHVDHFKGLPAIFDAYSGRIDSWWRPPLGGPDFTYFVAALHNEIKSEKEQSNRRRLVNLSKMIRALFDRAQFEFDTYKIELQLLQNNRDNGLCLSEEEHDFSIHCLGPSPNIFSPYERSVLDRTFLNLIKERKLTSRAPHNVISSVIAVRYGKWIGILGGDTEKNSWNDVLSRKREWLSLARFIKIPHHGSETGSYDRLWDSIDSDHCEAAVTCFESQGIPDARGLRHLRQPRFSLHSTTKALAESLYHGIPKKPVPPGFRRKYEAGEILVSVSVDGEMEITHVSPAGQVDLQSASYEDD